MGCLADLRLYNSNIPPSVILEISYAPNRLDSCCHNWGTWKLFSIWDLVSHFLLSQDFLFGLVLEKCMCSSQISCLNQVVRLGISLDQPFPNFVGLLRHCSSQPLLLPPTWDTWCFWVCTVFPCESIALGRAPPGTFASPQEVMPHSFKNGILDYRKCLGWFKPILQLMPNCWRAMNWLLTLNKKIVLLSQIQRTWK